jgi:hypothetical protein
VPGLNGAAALARERCAADCLGRASRMPLYHSVRSGHVAMLYAAGLAASCTDGVRMLCGHAPSRDLHLNAQQRATRQRSATRRAASRTGRQPPMQCHAVDLCPRRGRARCDYSCLWLWYPRRDAPRVCGARQRDLPAARSRTKHDHHMARRCRNLSSGRCGSAAAAKTSRRVTRDRAPRQRILPRSRRRGIARQSCGCSRTNTVRANEPGSQRAVDTQRQSRAELGDVRLRESNPQ